jgi:hypothetical protein
MGSLGEANLTEPTPEQQKALEEYFQGSLKLEDEAMPNVVEWIQQYFRFKLRRDVRKDPSFYDRDIDLIMEDLDRVMPSPLFIEVKVRNQLYEDILIETKKNVEQNKLGWIWTSEAQLLAYVFYVDGNLLPRPRYLIHLSTLREWFHQNQSRYQCMLAPNPPKNPVYHTEFYSVPPRDIPEKTFVLRLIS